MYIRDICYLLQPGSTHICLVFPVFFSVAMPGKGDWRLQAQTMNPIVRALVDLSARKKMGRMPLPRSSNDVEDAYEKGIGDMKKSIQINAPIGALGDWFTSIFGDGDEGKVSFFDMIPTYDQIKGSFDEFCADGGEYLRSREFAELFYDMARDPFRARQVLMESKAIDNVVAKSISLAMTLFCEESDRNDTAGFIPELFIKKNYSRDLTKSETDEIEKSGAHTHVVFVNANGRSRVINLSKIVVLDNMFNRVRGVYLKGASRKEYEDPKKRNEAAVSVIQASLNVLASYVSKLYKNTVEAPKIESSGTSTPGITVVIGSKVDRSDPDMYFETQGTTFFVGEHGVYPLRPAPIGPESDAQQAAAKDVKEAQLKLEQAQVKLKVLQDKLAKNPGRNAKKTLKRKIASEKANVADLEEALSEAKEAAVKVKTKKSNQNAPQNDPETPGQKVTKQIQEAELNYTEAYDKLKRLQAEFQKAKDENKVAQIPTLRNMVTRQEWVWRHAEEALGQARKSALFTEGVTAYDTPELSYIQTSEKEAAEKQAKEIQEELDQKKAELEKKQKQAAEAKSKEEKAKFAKEIELAKKKVAESQERVRQTQAENTKAVALRKSGPAQYKPIPLNDLVNIDPESVRYPVDRQYFLVTSAAKPKVFFDRDYEATEKDKKRFFVANQRMDFVIDKIRAAYRISAGFELGIVGGGKEAALTFNQKFQEAAKKNPGNYVENYSVALMHAASDPMTWGTVAAGVSAYVNPVTTAVALKETIAASKVLGNASAIGYTIDSDCYSSDDEY